MDVVVTVGLLLMGVVAMLQRVGGHAPQVIVDEPAPVPQAASRRPARTPVPRELCGSYSYFVTGRGQTLEIRPSGDFVFTTFGLCGKERDYPGACRYRGGVLRFVPDPSPDSFPTDAPPPLRPVRWGRRLYLVPLTNMRPFCLQVARGDEPRTSRDGYTADPDKWCLVFLRDGDETKRVRGLPKLGRSLRAYIRQLSQRR